MKEEWKQIEGFEGMYEISNIGRVKSLSRNVINGIGCFRTVKERILKQNTSTSGYLYVSLCKEGKRKLHRIHHLIWDNFGDKPRNGRKLQVDHKNEIKTDNRIGNLQLLTNRQNTTKSTLLLKTSSKYTGVCWNKQTKKWVAVIGINRKPKHLGYFTDELKASEAYQKALKEHLDTKITQKGISII